MSDLDDAEETAPSAGRGPSPKGLDRRTLAICACIALAGAMVAALVASFWLSGDDDGNDDGDTASLELTATGDVSMDRLLSVALETTEGGTTSLGVLLDGRTTLVNLWQAQCVPCVDEMPLFEQFHLANDAVSVIGVNPQERLDRASEMAGQTGITYPWVQDPEGNFLFEAKATAMPTTLLLDGDGRLLATKTGDFKSLGELESFVTDNAG